MRCKNLAYIAIGSNIKPEDNIRKAIELLGKYGDLVAVSSIWETKPVGFTDQPNFLNGAAIIDTDLSPEGVKSNILARIESELHRVRTSNKNGPRTIDLDLVLYNEEIMTLPGGQKIPDKDLTQRVFVIVPMAEIAPNYTHPVVNKKLGDLVSDFEGEKASMIKREDLKLPKQM